jgi:hypothetical protein
MTAAFLLAGCDRQDATRKAIELGDRRVKVGAFREAVRAYEGALDGSAMSADVHYKIAVLYDDKLSSPIDASHHYGRCLELAPDGSRAKDAKMAKAECEKRLSASFKDGGFMTTAEAARLRNENERLQKTIAELRNPKPTPNPRAPNPGAPDEVPAGARKHLVQKGETLASIAYKYYRNRARSAQIKAANMNQLGGRDVIKPGMTLIIPELAPKGRS